MSVTKKTQQVPQLSIIITVHSEGILLHKTLASVRRATSLLDKKQVRWELLIHVDNPTANTTEYLEVHKKQLGSYSLFINHFGDLGNSRNFAVKQAKGTYVTFIDADDLMSQRWLIDAYTFLEKHERGQYIAHTESTVEFGASDSVVLKHGEINQATDTLLTVFSNRWNSIIMAPRELLLEEPYTPNSPGYGYEDWHLNCRFIAKGLHNVLIPKTVIFVRRKEGNSEWLRQKVNRLVLRANPLFNFENIRALSLASSVDNVANEKSETAGAVVLPPSRVQQIKGRVVPLLKRVPLAERAARKAYHIVRPVAQTTLTNINEPDKRLPDWLVTEWRSIHSIEKLLFPSEVLIKTVPIYDSLVPEHYQTGEAFKKVIDCTTHNSYDYILFVPWLKTGGADLLSIHYVTALRAERPSKNIMVVATLPTDSPWANKLPSGIDFVPFGQITEGLTQEVQYRLLEQLIENSGAQFLHIINSALAYDFATSHTAYLTATDKKLIATSFSQSVDGTGRVFGYSHTHIPTIYDVASTITSDNQAVIDMWTNEYGFNPDKLVVQHTPIAIPKLDTPERPRHTKKLHILWAARLSPEKQPELVRDIARLLKDKPITIDMYGVLDHPYDQAFVRSLPANVTYKGSFDGFFNMPIEEYDALLYTSLFDGMPITLLEAASARLPIVSSEVGGIPSFITNKQSGVLISDVQNAQLYADALTYLLEHPKTLKNYSDKLYERLIERHSEAAYAKQVKNFAKRIGY